MQVVELEQLVSNAKGVTERDVRDALEVIRQVEALGGKRSQYNLASPFSRMPKPTDPRMVLKRARS